MRQWVLSLPYRLRYVLAWNHELCRAVLGVFARTLLASYRQRAMRCGTVDGRTGTLTVIQRFGGGLNLNVHFHTLVLDGVFTEPVPGGPLVFHSSICSSPLPGSNPRSWLRRSRSRSYQGSGYRSLGSAISSP